MAENKAIDVMWDDDPIDITPEANFIWSIANKLRGSYMPDKYGDVIIPMTIIRRFECALEATKKKVVETYKKNANYPAKAMQRISGYQFYNTSEFDLKELCNDSENIAANFREYISGFSANVQDILRELNMDDHIKKMDKDGCLYSVVNAFSTLDLSIQKFDSIKMGYIFENLIGRFYQNVDAGQFYTGRDIIKLLVSLLMAEGCDDIFDDGRVITVCDQACGTGGMLSTAYSYIRHFNPTADVRLFGQELMGQSYAVGLAEMLIKGQNAENFRHEDTLKKDCFPDTKMRFVIENPPFGTPWSGADAKDEQETEVKKEYAKGLSGRWGAGLPGGGDSQLLFMQSAIAKLDDKFGRAAIIENGSPLFAGGTSSGESQVRRWLLENDLIEAIVAMPTDLFYNTGIATYVWILSKNKRTERRGKVQLIDATGISHKLRKPLGNKKNEFKPEDRAEITRLYANFEENEFCKIFPNTEFIYREYTVMQPLQRSYSITDESIERMLQKGALSSLWDEAAVYELENPVVKEEKESKKKKTAEEIEKEKIKKLQKKVREEEKLKRFYETKPIYEKIIEKLCANKSNKKWLSEDEFVPIVSLILEEVKVDDKILSNIVDGLSIMDKSAVIQREKKGKNKGEIIYDKETKDIEIVKWDKKIEDYMNEEVLPHIPDAQWFWEENKTSKNPVIKIGAEIPFTRYFYKYFLPDSSKNLEKNFLELEVQAAENIQKLFMRGL